MISATGPGPTYTGHLIVSESPAEFLRSRSLTVAGEPVRVLADGDMVVVHAVAPRRVGFEIFRLAAGAAAEHWSAYQPLVDGTASGHRQHDGPETVTQPGQTNTSRKVIDYFIDRIMIAGDFDVLCRFVTMRAVQHDPTVADGVGAMWAALHEHDVRYEQRHLTVAEGEFAFTACTGTRDGQAAAFYDLFRLEHAMIAEHWSVVTETPTQMPRSAVAPPPPARRVDPVMRSLLDPLV